MLLMHGGLGLDHTTLRPWLDPLADRLQLIFFDHLANGRSTYSGDRTALDHRLWVETADALRSGLGHERLIVFGHSYGALLALEYTLRHGDRVEGLILSNVAPALDYPDVVMSNAKRKSPDDEVFQSVIRTLSGPSPDDAAWAESFRAISPLYFHSYEPARHDAVLENVRFRAEPANRSTFGCLPTYDLRGRLGEIHAPTLVISGADDWIMPPEHAGARVAAEIEGAEHVIFERSGHWPFVEETDRFIAVAREWLTGAGLVASPHDRQVVTGADTDQCADDAATHP